MVPRLPSARQSGLVSCPEAYPQQTHATHISDNPPANTTVSPLSCAPRRGAVSFIFVTILLDMFALGLILPILPKLVESFVDNDTARAAEIFGLFGTAWALMQFLF